MTEHDLEFYRGIAKERDALRETLQIAYTDFIEQSVAEEPAHDEFKAHVASLLNTTT